METKHYEIEHYSNLSPSWRRSTMRPYSGEYRVKTDAFKDAHTFIAGDNAPGFIARVVEVVTTPAAPQFQIEVWMRGAWSPCGGESYKHAYLYSSEEQATKMAIQFVKDNGNLYRVQPIPGGKPTITRTVL